MRQRILTESQFSSELPSKATGTSLNRLPYPLHTFQRILTESQFSSELPSKATGTSLNRLPYPLHTFSGVPSKATGTSLNRLPYPLHTFSGVRGDRAGPGDFVVMRLSLVMRKPFVRSAATHLRMVLRLGISA
ncbi:hypothetical protein QE152_g39498 [Popillia japonica]|uniref:Uncharacterized protein n=1 Tax=Popillia japonica TaxID=7064 RepID=A0AAW1HTX5_POPJA